MTPPKLEPLKPCPFCGSRGEMLELRLDVDVSNCWRVQCYGSSCSISGPEEVSRDQAIAAWNTRAGGKQEQ